MISKNLYFQFLYRVIILVAAILFFSWLIFEKELYILSIIIGFVIIILVANLIYFLNVTNRRLCYFFDAIKNEDSTLRFPEKTGNKNFDELNKSLNKVNRQIQQIQIENRLQEQYFQALIEKSCYRNSNIQQEWFYFAL